jgi:hypothetical protein
MEEENIWRSVMEEALKVLEFAADCSYMSRSFQSQ